MTRPNLIFLIFYTLIIAASAKYAYVTIHYEGTARDDEYVLGIRVLVESIKTFDDQNDVIVLVNDNVRPKVRNLFQESGAIVRQVSPIQNPYKNDETRRKYYQSRFDQSLIKLYVWNLTEYERVIYLDGDTILLHSVQDLFHCGHFCVVYMNMVAFHTALLVVKPNATQFQEMVNSLQSVDSFDGADQGFFVSYFAGMQNAPMYDASQGESEEPMNRLPLGYCMNHIYFYERSSWDHGYRTGQFKNLRIPAYVLTYPITPNLKPWYWWGYIWLQLHWEWQAYRSQLDENWVLPIFLQLIVLVGMTVLTEAFMFISSTKLYRGWHLPYWSNGPASSPSLGVNGNGALPEMNSIWITIGSLVWCVISIFLAIKLTPALMPPSLALPMFSLSHSFLFCYFMSKILDYWYVHTNRTNWFTIMQMMALCMIKDFITYKMSSADYSNPVLKLWMAFLAIQAYLAVEVYLVRALLITNKRHKRNK